MTCRGTNVALTLLHLHLLNIHFVHCYKPSHKAAGMTGFHSTEETGERLGSVLLSLSQESSLLPIPPLPRITSPRPGSSHLLPPDSRGADT